MHAFTQCKLHKHASRQLNLDVSKRFTAAAAIQHTLTFVLLIDPQLESSCLTNALHI